MKKIIGLILLFFITFELFSQSNPPMLFNEDFKDNSNEWVVSDDSEAASDITNGYYNIYNKSTEYAYRFWNSFEFDFSKDFIVEAKMRQVYGDEDYGYGIMFVSEGVSDNYNFEISSNGYYRITNQLDGEYDDKDWVKTEHVKAKNEYNILKVKKNSGYLYYYINDKLVNAVKYTKSLGNDFGFVLRSKMKVQVDYIYIYGTEEKINIVENPIKNPIENLGNGVNTTYSELIPVISPDGKTIYFVRDNYPSNVGGSDVDHNDIWYTTLQGDKWTTAKNIGRPLNNVGHNFIIATTADNNTLILNGTYTAFGEDGGNGISMSNRLQDGTWSIPKTIEIEDFYNDDKYQNFSVSNDLQVVISAIQRDDTFGESDLYVSFRKSDGTYTAPLNMGSTINTSNEEGTPFLASDNKTLYFYSMGHKGYGSADVFVSKRLDNTWTKWSTPLNLGSNINTTRWDAYFTLDAKGEYAYFVSSHNSIGEEDIFRVKLQEELQPDPVVLVYGKVYDKKTNKPLSSEIFYDDMQANKQVGVANSNGTTGEYKIILPYGKNYGFYAKKQGYMALSDKIDLTKISEYTEIERNLYLAPIEVNQQIILNNLFFEKGKADILPNSYPELDRLVVILVENPNMEIEISGFTNNIGDKAQLMELSLQRAEAVKKYLVEKSIKPERIKTKGMGPENPIAPNNTEEGRAKNQRVEFKITKK